MENRAGTGEELRKKGRELKREKREQGKVINETSRRQEVAESWEEMDTCV